MENILTIKQLEMACGGRAENCDSEKGVADIVTDSRKITQGSVFVALRGEKFDGHNFAGQAIEKGAVCSIVDENFDNKENIPVIVVEDTYKALRDAAKYYRDKFVIPAVAITGSVGKPVPRIWFIVCLEINTRCLKQRETSIMK